MKLTIIYADVPPVEVRVPDMGLTSREWAIAAYAATFYPTDRYPTPGATEIARALRARPDGPPIVSMEVGDAVIVAGQIVRMVEDHDGRPKFAAAEPVPVPHGPAMYVSADVAPPDAVAYVEDHRDRLWTGRGLGLWTCLTDPAGRTTPGMWAGVWREHGPLTPLVPVERLDEPESSEWTPPHRDVLPGGRAHADAAGPFG